MVEDILREMKVRALAGWLQKTLRPISDPWHEGVARRLPSPKATARYIIDLLEDVEISDMIRHLKGEEGNHLNYCQYPEGHECTCK